MSQEKEAIAVRVNRELMDEIIEVKEETGMSKSDTTRELIREGLQARNEQEDREDIKEQLARLDERMQAMERKQDRSTLGLILNRILR
jgi:predicted Rossmann fold nucleotide-binding protein DprA/Smf involved in DNA uptake